MNKDKKILYAMSFLTFAVLLIALFANILTGELRAAFCLLILTPLVFLLIKKRSAHSIHKREILLLLCVIGALYVILTHMSGLFFGYYTNPYYMSAGALLQSALPIAFVIVTIEIIRSVMLAQKNRIVSFLCYFSCVTAEILILSDLHGIESLNQFMDLFGMTLFPAITANALYHFLSKRYGALPNIAYRIITTLYIYFLPTVSAMSDSISAFIKLLFPLLLLVFVSALYENKKKLAKERKSGIIANIATALSVILMISIVMIVSCQFRIGALVIATESMTGEINKGDVILYERYDGQAIEVGQVIVFEKQNAKIVHRVVDVENVGGVTRYYTKGDANETVDHGYITDSEIIGLTDIKIAYLGYPTLWLNEIVSAKNQ